MAAAPATDAGLPRTRVGRDLIAAAATARVSACATLATDANEARRHQVQLAACLQDADERVRELAVVALGGVRPMPAGELADALRRHQPLPVRRRAASMLGGGAAEAEPAAGALAACLVSPDAVLRETASIALGTFGAPAVEPIRQVLHRTTDETTRLVALDALAMIGPDARGAEAEIRICAEARDDQVRTAASAALVAIDPDAHAAAREALVARLDDERPAVRRFAVERLGRLRAAAAPTGEGLVKRLADTDADVRAAAALAVARVGVDPVVAIPALARCLDDPSPRVRRDAAAALSGYGAQAEPARVDLERHATGDIPEVAAVCRAVCVALDRADVDPAANAAPA